MKATTKVTIKILEFIRESYKSGLIGISELSKHLNVSKIELIINLTELFNEGHIIIINKYWCLDGHQINKKNFVNDVETYCGKCKCNISNSYIGLSVHIKPIKK